MSDDFEMFIGSRKEVIIYKEVFTYISFVLVKK